MNSDRTYAPDMSDPVVAAEMALRDAKAMWNYELRHGNAGSALRYVRQCEATLAAAKAVGRKAG